VQEHHFFPEDVGMSHCGALAPGLGTPEVVLRRTASLWAAQQGQPWWRDCKSGQQAGTVPYGSYCREEETATSKFKTFNVRTDQDTQVGRRVVVFWDKRSALWSPSGLSLVAGTGGRT
jgi:hypothetical protein